MIISIIIFLIIFSVVVISHEFGHFAIARRNGIRVNEFDVGMGPMLAHRKVGETDFCIRLLPVGGACIFDGLSGLEEEETILDEHSFPNAGVYARTCGQLYPGLCPVPDRGGLLRHGPARGPGDHGRFRGHGSRDPGRRRH